MNQFIEKYKSLPNSDLVKISENPGDYQKDAVEAAHWELERRDLTNREWEDARMVLKVEEEQKSRSQKNKRELEQGIQDIFSSLLDRINPIQKDKPTDEKTIRLITLLFMIWSVYGIISSRWEFRFLFEMIGEGKYEWAYMISLLPIIGIPIGTLFFAMRKRVGWMLLNVFLGFTGITMIVNTIMIIQMQFSYSSSSYQLFQPPHLGATDIIMPVVIGLTIWTFCRVNIRQKFNITKGWMINSFVYAALLALVLLVMIF